MALTPKEEKELARLQEKKNTQTRINASTQEKIDLLLAKQNTKLSEQLKISKSINKASEDYDKALKSSEKSLGNILGNLVKGNVAAAAQEALGKKTLGTSLLRAKVNDKIQSKIEKQRDFSKLDGQNKVKILDLVNGINTGMFKQADVAATIEDIGKKKIKDNSQLEKILTRFASLSDKERKAKEDSEKHQKAITKLSGEMLGIFGVLAGVATKFASTIDSIGKEFGNLNVLSNTFKNELIASSVEATKIGGSIQEVSSIAKSLSSEFGITSEEAAKISSDIFDSSVAIGLSADEGSKLFGTLMQTAGLSRDQAEQLAEGTFQLANMNGVAPSVVMKDIAASSETIALFSKDGAQNIGEAAVQARRLGVSLDTTAKIAEGLLDFESSITKEVEASVLIGKQLNFQKAREAALSGDIAGATREVVKQVGSEQDFLKLNLIQRKALADSIGVSVTEMSKLVGETDKLSLKGALASGSFADLLGEDSLSALSKAIAQVKALGATVINDLGPALLGIVGAVTPFVTGITSLVSGMSELGVLLPIITGGLTYFAAKSVLAAGASVKKAFADGLVGAMKIPFPGNIAAGIATVAALGSFVATMNATKVDDFKSGPGGITTMMGPAGVFSLNPRDSVLATTNPIPVNDMRTGPAGSMNAGVNVNVGGKISGRDIVFFQENGAEFGDAPGNGLM